MRPEDGHQKSDEERELRDGFARLRDEERRHVTPFHALLSRPIEHQSVQMRASWVRIAAAAAVLAMIVGLTISRTRWIESEAPIAGTDATVEMVDLGATAWTSPTDFLLELPSQELLEGVPGFGPAGGLMGENLEHLIDDTIERRNRT